MTVRKARQDDLPALLDIYNYEVRNGDATLDINEKTPAEWQAWFDLHSGRHVIIVSEIDGQAAGYASLSPYREKEAYYTTAELSVYVHEKYRRQGVGEGLTRAILGIARENGFHNVISVITGTNSASISLHEKLGFSHSGTLHEIALKNGRFVDIVNLELIIKGLP